MSKTKMVQFNLPLALSGSRLVTREGKIGFMYPFKVNGQYSYFTFDPHNSTTGMPIPIDENGDMAFAGGRADKRDVLLCTDVDKIGPMHRSAIKNIKEYLLVSEALLTDKPLTSEIESLEVYPKIVEYFLEGFVEHIQALKEEEEQLDDDISQEVLDLLKRVTDNTPAEKKHIPTIAEQIAKDPEIGNIVRNLPDGLIEDIHNYVFTKTSFGYEAVHKKDL